MTKYLIALGVVLALVAGSGLYGYQKGKANVQAKWDVAEARALARGVDARTAAEAAIPPVEAEAVPRARVGAGPAGTACRVPDLYDRDCH